MIKQEQLKEKINSVKGNLKNLWSKYSENDFALTKERMNKISERVNSKLDEGKTLIKQRRDKQSSNLNTNELKTQSSDENVTQNFETQASAPLSRVGNEISAAEIEDVGADGILDEEEAKNLASNRAKAKRGKKPKADQGVKYYATENSELAAGAEKVTGGGIDSFGEEDTFDPEEADEHQTFRDRKQNSDLNKRFNTSGLNTDSSDLNRH